MPLEFLAGVDMDMAPTLLREYAEERKRKAPKTGERDAVVFAAMALALEEMSAEDRTEGGRRLEAMLGALNDFYDWCKPHIDNLSPQLREELGIRKSKRGLKVA